MSGLKLIHVSKGTTGKHAPYYTPSCTLCFLLQVSKLIPRGNIYQTPWYRLYGTISISPYINARRRRALTHFPRYFADDIFKRIFLNENGWILIEVSLKFVPKGPIDNKQALV